jgi:hypothetical protein
MGHPLCFVSVLLVNLVRVIRFALAAVYSCVRIYSFISIAVSSGLDWDVTNGCGKPEKLRFACCVLPAFRIRRSPNTFSAN